MIRQVAAKSGFCLRSVRGNDGTEQRAIIFCEIQCGVNDGVGIGFFDLGQIKLGYEIRMKNDMGKLEKGIKNLACQYSLISVSVRVIVALDINSCFGLCFEHGIDVISSRCQEQHHKR